MRTTIIGLVTALAVTAGAVQPASAQTSAIMSAQLSTEAFSSNSTDPESELSNGSSSESSTDATESDPGSSDSELTAVIGVLAVAGLIAGGLYWAVQQHIIPNPLPGIIPGPPAPQSAPAPAPAPALAPAPAPAPANNYVYYKNCAAVRAAGKAPLYRGQPGYEAPRLDRDHDGIACE
ncbi:MAG: excalibur calcium-binding domain-containing protein [Corynebacterium marinum]|uniref:Excalibur calcium-binding domain-containing protein n=1 Tax=Corynebacterium marinum TaxID=349751 RepID=A0A847H8M3_9CORY|nr:excalibur calcium-binding domain-containing protein [Corynebacterium marinum]